MIFFFSERFCILLEIIIVKKVIFFITRVFITSVYLQKFSVFYPAKQNDFVLLSEHCRQNKMNSAALGFPGLGAPISDIFSAPKTITANPISTAASVIGLQYKTGVIIAADVLASYGSLARFRDCPRLMRINHATILGAGGDYADYQYLKDVIEGKMIEERNHNDGFHIKPRALHSWLTRLLYSRRSKFDPLWNIFIIGGVEDGKPFLGYVDKLGTGYDAPHIATGFGTHLALPILREALEKNPDMTEEQAEKVVKDCIRLLYYRDARSFPKFQIATVNADGAKVSDVLEIDSDWSMGHVVKGY